jgi:WD40 repeat protein
MVFNGFISYSHAADGRLAPAVQRGLHRLAKPWHRRRALWIFRDQTGLAVTPGLWSSIQKALDSSDYFLLMASPEAAQSSWVNREIDHWLATKSVERILPVLTDGTWQWDPVRGDFAEGCTAVPAALWGVFTEEPRYLDLRWARDDRHLSLRHTRFRDAIAELAAPMHGVSKDDLEGEDVSQHRRAQRFRLVALATLMGLAVVAIVTGLLAVRNASRANEAAAEVLRQQEVAVRQQAQAKRSEEHARQQTLLAEQQRARAQAAAAETRRQERLAREQKGLAREAGAEADRQQRAAVQAAARARDHETQAKRARHEAQRQRRAAQRLEAKATAAATEASRQEQIALEQEVRATEARAEARRQERVAIGRRLINQAEAAVDDNPATALMLGVAAQRVQPEAEVRKDLFGLITRTRYAGMLKDVYSVAYGPDGLLATTDENANVSLWKAADHARPVRLARFDVGGPVRTLSFSPDGRTLAVVDSKGTGTLWNVADRVHPVRAAALPAHVSSVAFSSDRRTLATGGAENATLWNVADPTRPVRLSVMAPGDWRRLVEVVLSPDGRTLVMNSSTTTVWDVSDPVAPKRLTMLDGSGVAAMTFRPTGRPILVVQRGDGSGQVWDLTEPSQPARSAVLTGHTDPVVELAFSLDGRILASGDMGGTATMWDMADPLHPVLIDRVSARRAIASMVLSPDGRTMITTGRDAATFWSVPSRGAPEQLADLAEPSRLQAMAFGSDGRSLATAGADATASLWDLTDLTRPVRRATLPARDGETVTAFTADGRTAAAVGPGRVTLRDVTDPAGSGPLATLAVDAVDTLGKVSFSPDGRMLAVATQRQVMLWDLTDRRRPIRLSTLRGHGAVRAIAFSSDSRTVAVVDSDRTTLWDVTNRTAAVRRAVLTANGDILQVSSIAFAADGRTLATGVGERAVILWDVTDSARPHSLAELTAHSQTVVSLAFSPDRRTLAAAGGDGRMTLWDITYAAKPLRAAMLRHTSPTDFVVFSPDGRTVAVGTDSQTGAGIALWDYTGLNTLRDDPARQACAIALRGLTPDEWKRAIPELDYQRTCND